MLYNTRKLVLSILLTCLFLQANAQNSDTTQTKRNTWFGLPLVFFTPETSWGFGAAGIYAFRLKGEADDSRPSQIQLGFAFTLEKQFLSYLPFQLFIKQKKYNIYGELGYYRYNYFYYGIGNGIPNDFIEKYDVTFPRVRLNFLRQVKPNWYAGLRYWMDDFDITGLATDGELIKGDVTGSSGGLLSGIGLVSNYDSRDNLFYPSKGALVEMVFFYNGKTLGSDFYFQKLYIDAAKYINTWKSHVLALHGYGEFTRGDAPFNQLALMGGGKRMRGFYEGRFRDKHFMLVQAAYRFPLFWRLGMEVFGSYGGIAPSFGAFKISNFKYGVGAGLRVALDKKEKINLRVDAGYGQGGTLNYYVTIGEAF